VQGLRGVAAISFLLGLVWLVAGPRWDTSGSLQLIRVSDLAPRDVEPGDRVAIVGEGFPAGKAARVTFRGVLHRPGALAQKGAEISVWGTVAAPDRVEVAFDDAAEALFCGAGDRATHTTFEGDLEVAFASALPGAPPIAGFLGGVTFDVRPGPSADASEREREADRFLAFVGLHVAPQWRGDGLRVDALASESRAQAAGIATGDVLESFDGVRVRSPGDILPAPGEHDATVVLRRVSVPDPVVRTVCVGGFRPELPGEWVASALAILGALGIVLLFAAPTPTGVSKWLQFAIGRARNSLSSRRSRRSMSAAAAVAWADVGGDVVPVGPFAVVDAAACALIALLPFGQFRLASTLDVGILFAGSASALVAATLVSGRSIGGGARPALNVAVQHALPLVAVASAVLVTGSLRFQEIARAQGGWPWDWLVFQSPAAPIALVMLLSCVRIDFGAEGEIPDGPWLRAVLRAYRIVVSGLASVLFLGAWSIPGSTFAEQDAHPILQLLGAACLVAKTALVVLGTAWSRWVLAPLPLAQRARLAALWLFPAGVVTFGLMAVWSLWSPRPAMQATLAGALLIAAVLGVAALAQRLRHGLLSPTSDARLSPFL
jgi:NADH-quinone oxidoreductase subunit H